jgi:hypothetical protein
MLVGLTKGGWVGVYKEELWFTHRSIWVFTLCCLFVRPHFFYTRFFDVTGRFSQVKRARRVMGVPASSGKQGLARGWHLLKFLIKRLVRHFEILLLFRNSIVSAYCKELKATEKKLQVDVRQESAKELSTKRQSLLSIREGAVHLTNQGGLPCIFW